MEEQQDTEAEMPSSSTDAGAVARDTADNFRVLIDKTGGEMLGIDVGMQDANVLLVRGIAEGGLVDGWNKANPLCKLRPGDMIVELNGVRNNANAMLEECKKDQTLQMVVQRESPAEFAVHLSRDATSQRLGVDVDTTDSVSILIEGVKSDGLIAAWNASNPGEQVLDGDRIVEVNGARNTQGMLAECGEQLQLHVVVRREARTLADSSAAARRTAARRAAQDGQRVASTGADARRLAASDEETQLAWAMAESVRMAALGAANVPAASPPRAPLLQQAAAASSPLLASEPASPPPSVPRRRPQPPPGPPPPDAECRLCLEAGSERLIAPCDCTGSMGWVHRSCLNEWRSRAGAENTKAMTECPTCHSEYGLTSTSERDDRRRKRLYWLRVSRDSALAFTVVQILLFSMALLIRECDSGLRVPRFFLSAEDGTWVAHHWWGDFFQHQLFHYYCAAVMLGLFSLGAFVVVGFGVSFFCPCFIPERLQDNLVEQSPRGPALVVVGVSILCGLFILVVIVLGIFVALFLVTLFTQKLAQRYIQGMRLLDVAERFAVVDRAGTASSKGGCDIECGQVSQDEVKSRLQMEVRALIGTTVD